MSFFRATQNFAYGTDVGEKWVHGGEVRSGDDPVVKAFPVFWEPVFEPVAPEPQDTPAPRRRRNA